MKKTKNLSFSAIKTPMGKFSVAVDDSGAIAAAVFGDKAELSERLGGAALVDDASSTAAARKQVEAWFKGKRREFSVKLSPAGSPFQKRVWAALRRIPYGATLSYGDVARSIGSSPRAVGRANATNPICVIVPCHRVIGADGSLTGYAFGESTKRRLLEFESRPSR
jgi:methylated-DNA-[protein]-cysteine S-methyltransferase